MKYRLSGWSGSKSSPSYTSGLTANAKYFDGNIIFEFFNLIQCLCRLMILKQTIRLIDLIVEKTN